MKKDQIYDIAVIGGGINGTGIAADAATRGLKVLLCEQKDLASGTSSASSKLIHGGLRYLEQYEYRLVREALNEREILLHKAKHLIKPLKFILPHQKKLRSRYLIRIGLFLYDHLSSHSTLAKTKTIYLPEHPAGKYLQSNFEHAFQYSDCLIDDSRLVIANALEAREKGADIRTYTQCISAKRQEKYWQLTVQDQLTHKTATLSARILINAAGPWVEDFLKNKAGLHSKYKLALVKGSHIVVPKIYQEDFAYILQNQDNRVIFIIPYLEDFSLIGTTDICLNALSDHLVISETEIEYLLKAVNTYLRYPISEKDIVHSFSGVRPLLKNHTDNPSKITRDYAIEMDGDQTSPPLISIFGGKLTTYRKLAEKVTDLLRPFFQNLNPSITSQTVLPGAEYENIANLYQEISKQNAWLNPLLLARYLHQYGERTKVLLAECNDIQDLGEHFGATLYQREIDYLITHEWAKTPEDILWRRTKLGYYFPENKSQILKTYINSRVNSLILQ